MQSLVQEKKDHDWQNGPLYATKSMNDIEYGRDVIVGVIIHQVFYWYASEKELWVLDQVKWKNAYDAIGFSTPQNFEDRFDIGVVDQVNADVFISHLENDRIESPRLRQMYSACDLSDPDSYCHLLPGLFVNFDTRDLVSNFPEPMGFENYAPEGWCARYGDFENLVPVIDRYWI